MSLRLRLAERSEELASREIEIKRLKQEFKRDILMMVEEHEKLPDSILNDAEIKDKIQEKISSIVKKWDKR